MYSQQYYCLSQYRIIHLALSHTRAHTHTHTHTHSILSVIAVWLSVKLQFTGGGCMHSLSAKDVTIPKKLHTQHTLGGWVRHSIILCTLSNIIACPSTESFTQSHACTHTHIHTQIHTHHTHTLSLNRYAFKVCT